MSPNVKSPHSNPTHHGWNEVHPVLDCEILGHMDLQGLTDPAVTPTPWPTDIGGIGLDTKDKVDAAIVRWCRMIEDKDETQDGGGQDDPEHDWVIHPTVDGCKPPIIIT